MCLMEVHLIHHEWSPFSRWRRQRHLIHHCVVPLLPLEKAKTPTLVYNLPIYRHPTERRPEMEDVKTNFTESDITEKIKAIEAKEAERKREEAERRESLLKRSKRSLRNSIIASVVFVLLTVVAFSAQTYAYFTDSESSAENKIQSGNLDIDTVEVKGGENVVTSAGESLKFAPGSKVDKIVKIKNSGTLPVYVRVKIDVTIDKEESSLPANWRELIIFNITLDDPATANVEGPWILKDGSYSYRVPLEKALLSEALFTTVTFSPEMGNQFTNSEITVTLTCQATQSDFNGTGPADAVWTEN